MGKLCQSVPNMIQLHGKVFSQTDAEILSGQYYQDEMSLLVS